MSRTTPSAERIHERARMLAAESIDVSLQPFEAAWLAEHLNGCAECRGVAVEYRAVHDELRSLQAPVPPRDLWARTSAALDAVDRAAPRASRAVPGSPARRFAFNRPLSFTGVAVGLVVVAATVSLLAQGPLSLSGGSGTSGGIAQVSPTPGSTAEAPLAVYEGTGYWMNSEGDKYSIKGQSTACSGTEACAVTKTGGETLGSIRSSSSLSAAIAPGAGQAAVWTSSKIAILPLSGPMPSGVSIDDLTPRPTASATPTAAVASPTPEPSGSAEPSPAETPTPAPSPTPVPTGPSVATEPVAILDGYEIVGSDPLFSPDGSWVAFSARPSDRSSGPDVFVWRAGMERAKAITTAHADLFSGWLGQRVLLSEFHDSGQVASYVFDPQTSMWQHIARPMLLPVADPLGHYVVYWAGSVRYNANTGLWELVSGHLYFDAWANIDLEPPSPDGTTPSPAPTPTASPSDIPAETPTAVAEETPSSSIPASPEATETGADATTDNATASPLATPTPTPGPQLLPVSTVSGVMGRWVVRWDAAGEHLAVWAAESASQAGTLALFGVDRHAGLVQADMPLLFVTDVLANLQFDELHLIYTSNADGKTYLVPIPQPVPTARPTATPAPTVEVSPTPDSGVSATPTDTDQPGS